MGPKKAQPEIGKKAEKKMKEKIIEDKTFGLKNKNKSKVVQNYVKSVQSQVLYGQQAGGLRKIEEQKFEQKKEKKNSEEAMKLLATLFKNAQVLTHAQVQEQLKENQAINLYRDPREGTENMPQDTIITCKFFLDAVEDEKYGWRWECPNGLTCIYRHMLPEGFVVTSKKDRDQQKIAQDKANQEEKKSLEEQIEEERAALKSDGLTPVTKESFQAWKARRAEKKQKDLERQMKEEEEKAAKGKGTKQKHSIMNGRALFTYNPTLFQDDENAVDASKYEIKEANLAEQIIQQQQQKNQNVQEEEEKVGEQNALVDESLFQGENVDENEQIDFD